MFWGLAIVCEEYFVPSLNILCEELNIPDDVAGATFMAAGASSPEMFTSFIALFVNHSAIGVGTVVGSEIFNHMIICAGSVLYSETGVLQLEKYLFTRDVLAYVVSLLTLIWALKSSFLEGIRNVFDSDERKKCLNVTTAHAVGLVLVYVLYVTLSAYSQNIIQWISGKRSGTVVQEQRGKEEESNNGAQTLTVQLLLAEQGGDGGSGVEAESVGANLEEDRMASFLASIVEADIAAANEGGESIGSQRLSHLLRPSQLTSTLPSAPVLMRSYQLQRSAKYYPSIGEGSLNSVRGGVGVRSGRLPAVDWTQSRASFVNDAPLYTWRSSGVRLEYLEPSGQNLILTEGSAVGACGASPTFCLCLGSRSGEGDLTTLTVAPHQTSAYLYQRVASPHFKCLDQWELRYFTVDRWGFYSRKGRTSAPRGPHLRIIDLSRVTKIHKNSSSRHGFELVCSEGEAEETMEFLSPTEEIQTVIVEKLETQLKILQRLTPQGRAECHRIAKSVSSCLLSARLTLL
jgi:Ca2+/Na+ antiporter